MISEHIKKILLANWGEKADAMDCYAEVKFIDETSDWACYVYALNPHDENEIACIINGPHLEICDWNLRELYESYNKQGDHPVIDHEYRKMKVTELYKRLREER